MGKFIIEEGYRERRIKLLLILLITITLGLSGVWAVTNLFDTRGVASNSTPVSPGQQIAIEPAQKNTFSEETAKQLVWPSYGQAAYGTAEHGVIAKTENNNQPVPIASLTKIVTALAVLKHRPLAAGDQGPIITLSEQDAMFYNKHVAVGGSVTAVYVGSQVTQYEALQALLMSSSNNMADTLVQWAFGSSDAYLEYANAMLAEEGLTNTYVADASGYLPQSVSTAAEMVELGLLYLENPILRNIALLESVEIPAIGTITNYNAMSNDDTFFGIKVGFTDEAGKTFVAAQTSDDDNNDIAVAVVLGADDWQSLTVDTYNLLQSGNELIVNAEE